MLSSVIVSAQITKPEYTEDESDNVSFGWTTSYGYFERAVQKELGIPALIKGIQTLRTVDRPSFRFRFSEADITRVRGFLVQSGKFTSETIRTAIQALQGG